jgi:hypothetical protein
VAGEENILMTHDETKSWGKLKEAMKVAEKCDATDCDCDKCLIGKPMQLFAHDAGVKVVASVCSMISCLRDVCLEPKEYRYKKD